jgi:hypothetical protein
VEYRAAFRFCILDVGELVEGIEGIRQGANYPSTSNENVAFVRYLSSLSDCPRCKTSMLQDYGMIVQCHLGRRFAMHTGHIDIGVPEIIVQWRAFSCCSVQETLQGQWPEIRFSSRSAVRPES